MLLHEDVAAHVAVLDRVVGPDAPGQGEGLGVARGDTCEIHVRYRGDIGEIQGRCGREMAHFAVLTW